MGTELLTAVLRWELYGCFPLLIGRLVTYYLLRIKRDTQLLMHTD